MARRITSSRTIAYVIQPYAAAVKGLAKTAPQRCDDRRAAIRAAERCAEVCAGVTVSEMEVDRTVDFCGEPRLIATFGQVPELAA